MRMIFNCQIKENENWEEISRICLKITNDLRAVSVAWYKQKPNFREERDSLHSVLKKFDNKVKENG